MTASLTTKDAATRQRIIEAAPAEIREFGVTVMLDDIRARARASKSQLFHYFPEGREQLLLAVARYRELGDQCPLSALITQLGRATPGAQAVVAELMGQWQAQIAAGIAAMQAAGEVSEDLDAPRTASAVLAGIQGGVIMMLSAGNLAALDLALEHLRCASPAPRR
jgi:AcrR family transcriptional regulator